jgi:hypothetical protein
MTPRPSHDRPKPSEGRPSACLPPRFRLLLLAVKTGAIRYRITWAQERSSYGRVLAQLIKHDYLDANEILLVGWCRLP